MKFSKRVITGMLVFLAAFTLAVLAFSYRAGYEPTAVITAVFAFCGAEGGLMAWIKNTDTKNEREKK